VNAPQMYKQMNASTFRCQFMCYLRIGMCLGSVFPWARKQGNSSMLDPQMVNRDSLIRILFRPLSLIVVDFRHKAFDVPL